MAIREIRKWGDEILLKPCKNVKEVTKRTQELIKDMTETMREAGGVGLAAPQVGVLKRIMIVETEPDSPVVFINPVIIKKSGEQTGYEGCLSIPGKTGIVTRPDYVEVEAYNEKMEKFTLEAKELFARAICHECDHLDGKLYVDLVEGELKNTEDLLDEDENVSEVEDEEADVDV